MYVCEFFPGSKCFLVVGSLEILFGGVGLWCWYFVEFCTC
jgi:hypothetical protein